MAVRRLKNVNGELIKWAREDAGYSLDDVVSSCAIADEFALKRIENNELKPTLTQAEKMADKFKRPIAFFYLKKIPKQSEHKRTDNRSPIVAEDFGPQAKLAIRRLNLVQDYTFELRKMLSIRFPRLPIFKTSQDADDLAKKLRKFLEITDMPRSLERTNALTHIIKKVEKKGIIVLQQKMPRTELQGASSMIPYPVILINHSDYTSSKIFTLIHELCHLCLRKGGYCLIEKNPSKEIETFCNAVAGETLVPFEELKSTLGNKNPLDEKILKDLSNHFSVSREVVLLRLIHKGVVGQEEWDIKERIWKKEYATTKRFMRSAGPVTRALRENGYRYTGLIIKGVAEGKISSAQAGRYLNVKSGILEDVRKRV